MTGHPIKTPAMSTAVRTLRRATLDDLRAEIDAIDDSLHDLLMRRAGLAGDIARLKAKAPAGASGPLFRPGREAAIVRRILARHKGPFPPAALVRIWREVIGALLRLQGPLSVATASTGLNELARDHFGTVATVRAQATSFAAIRAVSAARATVAVVPWPATTDSERPWWLVLAKSKAPRVVAALPALSGKEHPEALAVAAMTPEPSGNDRSLIAIVSPKKISQQMLTRAGFKGRIVARAGGGALLAVDGFVADTDARLKNFTAPAFVIGAYAVPSFIVRGDA
jgi:chorismate mutase/prephenate dehydratase